jgi:hypothetical protein
MSALTMGSQRLLQIAVTHRPERLLSAMRRAGAVGRRESLDWVSPLAAEEYREFKDAAALEKLRLIGKLRVPLSDFWPSRGCVWDGLALAATDRPVLVEAKAHIPEAASPPSQASEKAMLLIIRSLTLARRHYAPRSKADWHKVFYQYANRLAYQFYLRQLNGIDSSLVFLEFTNAADMDGPTSEQEWNGATRLIHHLLGLPADLTKFGIFHAYLDARELLDAA